MALQIRDGEAYPSKGDFDIISATGETLALITRGPNTGKTWVSCKGRMQTFPSRVKGMAWLSEAMTLPAITPPKRNGC